MLLQLAKRPILYAFGASDATIEYAVDFITIYLIGTVFVQLTLGPVSYTHLICWSTSFG